MPLMLPGISISAPGTDYTIMHALRHASLTSLCDVQMGKCCLTLNSQQETQHNPSERLIRS